MNPQTTIVLAGLVYFAIVVVVLIKTKGRP